VLTSASGGPPDSGVPRRFRDLRAPSVRFLCVVGVPPGRPHRQLGWPPVYRLWSADM